MELKYVKRQLDIAIPIARLWLAEAASFAGIFLAISEDEWMTKRASFVPAVKMLGVGNDYTDYDTYIMATLAWIINDLRVAKEIVPTVASLIETGKVGDIISSLAEQLFISRSAILYGEMGYRQKTDPIMRYLRKANGAREIIIAAVAEVGLSIAYDRALWTKMVPEEMQESLSWMLDNEN